MDDRKTTPATTRRSTWAGACGHRSDVGFRLQHSLLVSAERRRALHAEDINFVNQPTGRATVRSSSGVGERNLTFRAWIRWVGQLYARRCDNMFRIDGLRNDE